MLKSIIAGQFAPYELSANFKFAKSLPKIRITMYWNLIWIEKYFFIIFLKIWQMALINLRRAVVQIRPSPDLRPLQINQQIRSLSRQCSFFIQITSNHSEMKAGFHITLRIVGSHWRRNSYESANDMIDVVSPLWKYKRTVTPNNILDLFNWIDVSTALCSSSGLV